MKEVAKRCLSWLLTLSMMLTFMGPLAVGAVETEKRPNLALYKPAKASASSNGGFRGPAGAVDNIVKYEATPPGALDQPAGWWATGPNNNTPLPYPQWWQVDLEGIYLLDKTELVVPKVTAPAGGKVVAGGTKPLYTIEVSADEDTWTKVVDKETENAGDLAESFVDIFNAVEARYIKVTLYSMGEIDALPIIAEFRAYGEAAIASIVPVMASTAAGIASTLPNQVKAVYSDGSEQDVTVTWPSIDAAKYANAGIFTVEGTAEGKMVTAYVTVTGATREIVSFVPVTASVEQGGTLVLPGKVTAVYSDNTTEEEAVTWDAADVSAAGTVTVEGTVDGTAVKAKATVAVAELTNVAKGKPSISSDPDKKAATGNANDDNTNTMWDSNGFGQWWQVDMGEMHHVTEFKVTTYPFGTAPNARFYKYIIYASNDGVQFTSIFEKNGEEPAAIDLPHPVNVDARYFRVLITWNSGNAGVHLKEFKAIGIKLPAVKTFDHFETVTIGTTGGIAPAMPETVTTVYKDNTTAELPVTWAYIAPTSYAGVGSFDVTGLVMVDGAPRTVTATVTVIKGEKQFTHFEPLPAVNTTVGTAPNLPAKVTAVYSDSSKEQLAVAWKPFAASKAGSFTVKGAVTVGGEEKEVTVTVIVAKLQGPNRALNKPTEASSFAATREPSKVVDGDEKSMWFTAELTFPGWWLVDLQAEYALDKLELVFEDAKPTLPATNAKPKYIIEGSTDRQNWSPIVDMSANTDEKVLAVHDGLTNVKVRYLRVTIHSMNAVNRPLVRAAICEFRAYGDIFLKGYEPVHIGMKAGEALTLPATVTALYSDGTRVERNVSWGTKPDVSVPGSYTVEGTVDSEEMNITATVTVISGEKEIVSFREIAATTTAGTVPTLPTKVTAVYNDDTTTEMDVDWGTLTPVQFANEGIVTVEGTVDITTIKAIAKVTVSLVNIALNKPATASSYYPGAVNKDPTKYPVKTWAPDKANDGNTDSYWDAAPYRQWWQVDLGAEKLYSVKRVKLLTAYDGTRYYKYGIYASTDGINFSKIAEKSSDAVATAAGETYHLDIPVKARFLRVMMTYNSASQSVHIREFEAYGTLTEEAAPALVPIASKDYADSPYKTLTDPIVTARGIMERVVGKAVADEIQLELIAAEKSKDVFELETVNGKTVIRGNSGVALASGFNWFLKYYCYAHTSWSGDQLNTINMPEKIPVIPKKVRIDTPYEYRYDLNYCTHSYTMAFWDWNRWQQELDWMAMNGINLVLNIVGHEEVWRRAMPKLGYTEAEAKEFIAGPAYYGWQFMSNLFNFGGPVPDHWYEDRVELSQQINQRMLSLGMKPVLPGYSGLVPADFAQKYPTAKVYPQGNWCGFKRPDMLDPMDPKFAEVAKVFYEEQAKLFGPEIHYYSTDPFHEGGDTTGVDLPAVAAKVQQDMLKHDPRAIWVLQGWQDNPKPGIVQGLDKEKSLILDLFADLAPNWDKRNAFDNTPWIWCMLNNFGGRIGLHGNLKTIATEPIRALKNHPGTMKGIGIIPEAIESGNPVMYDLMMEMTWHKEEVDVDEWLMNYTRRRYGKENAAANQAWQILNNSAYDQPFRQFQLGASVSIINARPAENLDYSKVAMGGPVSLYYERAEVEKAAKLLLSAFADLKDSDAYLFDLADFSRQVLANSATPLYEAMMAAYASGTKAEFEAASGKFLDLIRHQDALLSTREEFSLAHWINNARKLVKTDMDKDMFEFNARALNTIWGAQSSLSVVDYANRQWSDLTGDFYLKRWERAIGELNKKFNGGTPNPAIVNKPAKGTESSVDAYNSNWFKWELDWVNKTGGYTIKPNAPAAEVQQKAQYALDNFIVEQEIVKNLAYRKPTSAEEGGGTGQAVDGDESSIWWVSPKVPQWWQVDLQNQCELDKIEIVFEKENRVYGYKYYIEASIDGTAWTKIVEHGPNTQLTKRFAHEFPEKKLARYLRVTILSMDGAGYPAIGEFRAFGTAQEANKTALGSEIQRASIFEDNWGDGSAYPEADRKAFLTAMSKAKLVQGNPAATQAEVDKALADLTAALARLENGTATYIVTFNSNGGSVVASQTVQDGGRVIKPTDPTKSDSDFVGWYTDAELTTVYSFLTVVTKNITLYAKWMGKETPPPSDDDSVPTTKTETKTNEDGSVTKTVTDLKTGTVTETTTRKDGTKIITTTTKDGKSSSVVTVPEGKDSVTVTISTQEKPAPGTVAVIVKPDGTKEIVKTSVATENGIRVTLTKGAKLEIMDNSKRFIDVETEDWFDGAVQFVASRELFNGTTPDTFSPDAPMSRAMLMTVLARLDGQDTNKGETWYSAGMEWAVKNNISDGTSPEQSITREQLAVMLYRYAKAEKSTGTLAAFPDADQVSTYAAEAMAWAVEAGILKGNETGKLNPGATATRAQVATMLERFLKH